MSMDLSRIDVIRERTGVSYAEARRMLAESNGDVVEALVHWERADNAWQEKLHVHGSELVDKVKEILHEGNVNRVVIKQDERTIFEIPVTWGAVGAVLLPTMAALGVVAAMVSKSTILVERREPRPDDRMREPIPDYGFVE